MKTMKKLIGIGLLAVLALSIAFCAMNNGSDNNDDPGNGTTAGTDTDQKSNNENSFSIDVAEKTNQHWKMTYKGCQIKNKLDSFTTAKDGEEFVVVFFEIENISEESQTFNLFYQSFYLDGIKTAQTVYGVLIDNSYQLASIPVEAGKKAKGYFLFQTTPDWNELEVVYDESLLHDDEDNVIRFILTKNEE